MRTWFKVRVRVKFRQVVVVVRAGLSLQGINLSHRVVCELCVTHCGEDIYRLFKLSSVRTSTGARTNKGTI